MKRTWLIVPALALCIAGSTRSAFADDAPATKTDKTEKRREEHKERMEKKGAMSARMRASYEAMIGKPLTDDQVKALTQEDADYRAAQEDLRNKHEAKLAATLGITVDQMKAAEDAERKKMMEERKNRMNPAPAAAPATGTAPTVVAPAPAK